MKAGIINAAAARLVPGLKVDLEGLLDKAHEQGLEATLVDAGCDLLVLAIKTTHAKARARRGKR